MPAIDPSIPLSVKVPDGMSSLGSFANTANAIRAYQTGQIEQQRQGVALEQEQGALDARKAISSVIADPQYRTDDGLYDLNKIGPAIIAADPKMYRAKDAIASLASYNNDTINVKKNALSLSDAARGVVGSAIGSLANDPGISRDKVLGVLDNVQQQAPVTAPIVNIWRKQVDRPEFDDPAKLQAFAMNARSQIMPPAQQIESQTPSGITVNNGQQFRTANTKPTAMPIGATIPGTAGQMQLPPTTPTFNPTTNTPGYLGPQGGGGVAKLEVTQPSKSAGIQSGPALGTAENIGGTVAAVNKDWDSTVESAKTASQDIGVLQNIKKYAAGAVTGVASDRRAYVEGLAGLLGMDTAQLAKTSTDLLSKNSKMLALAGGDTNLAKTMAESANPNTHMTPEAIQGAANQVIAQRKLALAKQQYMSHFKGDADLYTAKLADFNRFADPRILQLRDMAPDDIARMKGAMSPGEQREFGQKIREMQAAGLVQ